MMQSKTGTYAFVSTAPGDGKTTAIAAAAAGLRGMGVPVGVMVPVALGCRRSREGLVSPDAELLAHFADAADDLATISPYTQSGFDPPALAEGGPGGRGPAVDADRIIESHRRIARRARVVLMELHGGLLLPLGRDVDYASILESVGAQVVVVGPARARGFASILTLISCIRSRGLSLSGVVLNRYDAERASRADELSPEWIERFGPAPATYVLPTAKRYRPRPPRMDEDLVTAIGPLVRSWGSSAS